jgi:YD repeat-containing protein
LARYRATIDTPHRRDDVFAYLSDFSTTQEWDPGIVEAERLDDSAIGEGTEFRLVAEFLGRKTELTYMIVQYEPPHAVTLRGENATLISKDTITFDEADGITRLTYDAELALKGRLRIADPVLRRVFNRVGDRALAGLINKLGHVQGDGPAPAQEAA